MILAREGKRRKSKSVVYTKRRDRGGKKTGTEPQNVSILLLDLALWTFCRFGVALSMLNIKILKMPSGYATY